MCKFSIILVFFLFTFILTEKRCLHCKKNFSDKKKYCIYCLIKLALLEKYNSKEIPIINTEIKVSNQCFNRGNKKESLKLKEGTK